MTREHVLLLQAALLDGDRARAAFAEWTRRATGRLDQGSRRLLPLLHLNLSALGMVEADDPRFVHAFDSATAGNAVLVKAAASVLRGFRAAGIEGAVLKGLPLSLRYYPVPGARPMADCDLLVRARDARAAADSLEQAGWQPDARLDAGVLATTHARQFRRPLGASIDLHWHMLPESRGPARDPGKEEDAIWEAMEAINVGGAATVMPRPADMLAHVAVHGMRWSRVPPLRWAADAMMVLLKAGPHVDWDRLVARAAHQRVALPMCDALGFLRETLDAPVPADVMVRLARIPVSRADRLEYSVKQRPRTPARLVALHWFQHRRMSNGTLAGDVLRFPRYLGRVWGLRRR